jgi:HSP20 family protein
MSKPADTPNPSSSTPATQASASSAAAPARREAHTFWADPLAHLRRVDEEIDRAFHTLFGRPFPRMSQEPIDVPTRLAELSRSLWSPHVDVLSREGSLVVRADLPGLGKDDVSVEIDGRLLTIKGERKAETEEKKETYYRSERSYGSFYRSFRLPESADTANAKARFKNGVLEVEIPTPEAAAKAARTVEIEETASE